MKPPRGLGTDEAALWAKVAATVQPFHPPSPENEYHPHAKMEGAGAAPLAPNDAAGEVRPLGPTKRRLASTRARLQQPSAGPPSRNREAGLDSHWERRLRAGTLAPDYTLDLHEHSLDAAYQRLLGGLDMARESGARVVLVVAGRERPAPAADRSGQRGAIRAKLLDWLAASRHSSAIAAIRKAHRRHGGAGALYVILKKQR